ncbi:unnamed protein product, partial [Polarella glacialis]
MLAIASAVTSREPLATVKAWPLRARSLQQRDRTSLRTCQQESPGVWDARPAALLVPAVLLGSGAWSTRRRAARRQVPLKARTACRQSATGKATQASDAPEVAEATLVTLPFAAEFYEACRNGNKRTNQKWIKELLSQYPEEMRSLVGTPEDRRDKTSPFSYACWFGLADVVETMASRYADEVRSSVHIGMSSTCRAGKGEILDVLIKHFPEECRLVVPTELSEACRNSRTNIAVTMVLRFPLECQRAVVNPHSYDRTTPFYWACRNGLAKVVRLMLQEFPDEVAAGLSQADTGGRTALAWACESGHDDVVKYLLKHLPDASQDFDLELATEGTFDFPKGTSDTQLPEMVTPEGKEELRAQNFKMIGSHSAVKQCRWTRSALRGEGQCYKHTFYGISSHRCMEGTPSLACANKCTFCWRGHANPVTTSWKYQTDDPEWIVEESPCPTQ